MNRDRKRRQELEPLDKVSLIEGYLLLEKPLARLESQMDALKQAMGVKPEKTADNSSVPPSQGQKAILKPKGKAKRGPKKGHIGKSRQRQEPDEVVRYGRYCPSCQSYQRADPPTGYEPGRVLGPHLEGLVP